MITEEKKVSDMRKMINEFKFIVEQIEKKDFTVINNVNVKIESSDEMDLELNDEEKQKITKLIDDFHVEVSDIVDFEDFIIYENSVKLSGSITQYKLKFMFSSGDDAGLFLNNIATIKMTPEVSETIEKLTNFTNKFNDVTEDLIRRRKEN